MSLSLFNWTKKRENRWKWDTTSIFAYLRRSGIEIHLSMLLFVKISSGKVTSVVRAHLSNDNRKLNGENKAHNVILDNYLKTELLRMCTSSAAEFLFLLPYRRACRDKIADKTIFDYVTYNLSSYEISKYSITNPHDVYIYI